MIQQIMLRRLKLLSAFSVIFYNDVVHITCSLSHISKLFPFWYDAFSFQHCTASLRPYSEELTYQDITVKLVQRHYHLHFSQTTFNSCNVIIHAMYKAVQNRCPWMQADCLLCKHLYSTSLLIKDRWLLKEQTDFSSSGLWCSQGFHPGIKLVSP